MNGHPLRLSSAALNVLLRVGVFVLIAWTASILFPLLMQPLASLLIISALSTFAAGAIANAIVVRIFEHGQLSDFGLGWRSASGRELAIGIGIGAGSAVVIVAAAFVSRMAEFGSASGTGNIAGNLVFLAFVLLFGAAGEEMLFHGYAFQLLLRNIGEFATILPVGVIFGVAHLGNRNVTTLAIVNTIGWGILLGYAYLRARTLWLPIGMHFGWNVASPLLGVNLSGFTIGVTGYELHWKASVLWSGGSYGLEGSVFTSFAVIALFFVLHRVVPESDEVRGG